MNSPLPVSESAPDRPGSPTSLRIVLAGHVDHGKSTLIGRLLHDAGALPEGRLEQLEQAAARRGAPFEWANLTDALQAERDQNVTIDTARIWFRTPTREYVLIDAPGHPEFLRNLLTAAAGADAALLALDAVEGLQDNARRHAYVLQLLGVRQVAVLINKMDLVDYDQGRFAELESACREWLATLDLSPRAVLPIAARHGDNLVRPSAAMPWWQGLTVRQLLDVLEPAPPLERRPLRFPVQAVYRVDDRRILAGRVESGTLEVGARLWFSPTDQIGTVKTIERWNGTPNLPALAGECVGITLAEPLFLERGAVGALESSPPCELPRLRARVFWFGQAPLRSGRLYRLRLVTQDVPCEVESFESVVDAATLAPIERSSNEAGVRRHEAGDVVFRSHQVMVFDPHAELAPTGRLVVMDGPELAGAGIVLPGAYPRRAAGDSRRSPHVYWTEGQVTWADRARRNGHPGVIVWLTGLSGAGKSTLARELERALFLRGRQVCVLDGDQVRHGLCADLAFTPADRAENIRRVGEVALLMAQAGLICIAAFISPYREGRDRIRARARPGQMVEVYVNAPLTVCEARDPKGLYAKARAHQIQDLTGVHAPYEAPLAPELELRTDELTVDDCVNQLLDLLARRASDH